jgi:hypothetical protein
MLYNILDTFTVAYLDDILIFSVDRDLYINYLY